jgi:hypothetical protein
VSSQREAQGEEHWEEISVSLVKFVMSTCWGGLRIKYQGASACLSGPVTVDTTSHNGMFLARRELELDPVLGHHYLKV